MGGYDVGNLGFGTDLGSNYSNMSQYVSDSGFSDMGGGGGKPSGGSWYEKLPQLLGAGGNLVRSFTGGGDARSGGSTMGYQGMGLEPFDPAPVEEATEKVNTEYEKMLSQIGGIFNDIAYLTGTNLPTAVQGFRERYQDYMEPAAQRGYNMLFNYEPNNVGQTPISDYGDTAVNKIFGTASDFSALNRPGYMSQALNPSIVGIDPKTYQPQFDKYKQDAKSGDMFDYQSAATKALMTAPDAPEREEVGDIGPIPYSPKKYGRKQMGKFYANSGDVDKLMSFGSYFDA